MAKQYGLRIRKEIESLKWGELNSYISGLMADTPLGQIVEIRSENDKEKLKYFTPEQKRIRSEWREKQSNKISEKEYKDALEQMKQAFIAMAKEVKKK